MTALAFDPQALQDGPMVVLAAGGTGGHVFPALAVAEKLRERAYGAVLVTDVRGAHYDTALHGLPVARISAATLQGKNIWKRISALTRILKGVGDALGLLRQLRPVAVIGFGGYPSFPTLIAAILLRVPTILHEQNAVLGRANRFLHRWVDCLALSFENTVGVATRAFIAVTGNPVRPAIVSATLGDFRAPDVNAPFHLLIVGGSLGARILSELVPPALCLLPAELQKRLRVVQQCREEDFDQVRGIYQEAGIAAELAPFFTDMPERLANAHLVISRAGGSVAELTVAGRPALLFPYPHHADQQQKHNAQALVTAGGGDMFADATTTAEELAAAIAGYMSAPERLQQAAAAARRLGRPNAANHLVDVILQTAGHPEGATADTQTGGQS